MSLSMSEAVPFEIYTSSAQYTTIDTSDHTDSFQILSLVINNHSRELSQNRRKMYSNIVY